MKKLLSAYATAIVLLTGAAAYAGGAFQGYPLVGGNGTSNCLSAGNNGVCNQYQPAGPSVLTGNETFPADTNVQGAGTNLNPATVAVPILSFGNGYGDTTASTTTGTTALVQVADGISTFVYAGAGTATYTSFKLPNNPIDNQKVCLANAGSGILTLTAVAAGTNSFGNTPTITGVTPTSIPVMTAVGTAGTVTLGTNCWLYVAGASNNGVWYRVL
jgi:hypothetical protein